MDENSIHRVAYSMYYCRLSASHHLVSEIKSRFVCYLHFYMSGYSSYNSYETINVIEKEGEFWLAL